MRSPTAASLSASLFGLCLAGGSQATSRVGRLFALGTSTAQTAAIDRDFPDPSILEGEDGWYAFATRPLEGGRNVQWAKAPLPVGPWTYMNSDALPNAGPWSDNENTWAPDVRRVHDGTYVMYYTGRLLNGSSHCVGVARSAHAGGPWIAGEEPWTCDLDRGGSIDPSGFQDTEGGRRFVVYKIDGNSLGKGGACNNEVAPIVPTPIMLQEVGHDGTTRIGDAVQILDRTDEDGPLVEAPNLVKIENTYVLFFSSHCYTDQAYNVEYAISDSVAGPYRRTQDRSLLETGDYNLTSPGGATSIEGGGLMLFHANCRSPGNRCMYIARYGVAGKNSIFGE